MNLQIALIAEFLNCGEAILAITSSEETGWKVKQLAMQKKKR